MKRMRIMGLCLVAVFSLALVAVSSASATEPAFFECKAVGAGKGTFSKGCKVAKKGGGFEPTEGVGKGKIFKGKGGSATLHTPAVKGEITCTSFKDEGKITSPKNINKIISTFSGCSTLGKKCKSAGQKAGTIKTMPLKGEIGYISAANHEVGVDLTAEGADLADFECEGITVKVNGSVIGHYTPVNKFSKTSVNTFAVNGEGFQDVKNLEGQPTDVLESTINGSGPFESGQQASATNVGEELELKA
jgi:hypothetical protein